MVTNTNLQHTYINTNRIYLHTVQAGPLDGPPVILLHGFPEFWYGWKFQITALAEAGFRVWAPDQRGYYLSAKPEEISAYGIDELVADVRSVIEATGHSQVSLIGHDWGAAVAWWMALKHPDLLQRLVILNVPHPAAMLRFVSESWEQRLRSWYVGLFQLPWLPEVLMQVGHWALLIRAMKASGRPDAFSDEDLQRYREAWSQPRAMTSMINWYRAAIRTPPKPPTSWRVTPHTLIIWGVRDIALCRELAPLSLEFCVDGELFMLEEATHWLHHEEPDRVNQLILDFLLSPS